MELGAQVSPLIGVLLGSNLCQIVQVFGHIDKIKQTYYT